MKVPPDVEFHEDVRLVVWRPRGVINESMVNKMIAHLGELESVPSKPFNRLTDGRLADSVELNFKYMFHVSLYRRLSYRGRPVKSAIINKDEEMARYARMHAILTEGSALKVRLFNESAPVAEWLEVPFELVEGTKSDSSKKP